MHRFCTIRSAVGRGASRAADCLLLPPALLAVLVLDGLRPPVLRLARHPLLSRLRDRLARLPPGVALPLFLVPETFSRVGWFVSAWLVLEGHPWQALALYVATKIVAGLTAVWVYAACEPALLRVRWFARSHAAIHTVRRQAMSALPRTHRFGRVMNRLRRPQWRSP